MLDVSVTEEPTVGSLTQDNFDLIGDTDRVDETAAPEQWLPNFTPRQRDLFYNKSPILLLNGPRFSGKSIVLSHKTMKAAWETYDANIGIIVTSYKVATDGGVWIDLLDAAQEWTAAGLVSEYGHEFSITSVKPDGNFGQRVDAKNRTPFFTIRNKFGTNSTVRLFSIDNENEIEKKVKQLRMQFIWIVELSTFVSRDIVRLSWFQLRSNYNPVTNRREEGEFQLVADTNPADEGKQHWIYQWFYMHDAGRIPEELKAIHAEMIAKMCVEEVTLEDNTLLPEGKKNELIALYAGDPHNYQRFVLGEWPDGSLDRSKLFADLFGDNLMVEECIDLDELTDTLYCGYDLGPMNKAWVMLEKRIVEGSTIWCVIDELVYVGQYQSTEDFTSEVMKKMVGITEFYKKKWKNFKGFSWVHWSDTSSWAPNMDEEGGTEAVEVFNASNRQIELRPVDKPAKSVEVGCQIIRKIMREERFFMGRNTPKLETALRSIKRANKGGKTIDPGDKHKHCCDALRYVIYMECIDDLLNDSIRRKVRDNRTISIPL